MLLARYSPAATTGMFGAASTTAGTNGNADAMPPAFCTLGYKDVGHYPADWGQDVYRRPGAVLEHVLGALRQADAPKLLKSRQRIPMVLE